MIPELKLENESVKTALTGFIKREIDGAGLRKAVIGLSGGVDSSLAAHLSVAALGAENVYGVFMPYASSSPDSLRHARMVADSLGVEAELFEITPMVNAFLERNPDMDAVRKGNVMARQRMVTLFDRSARERGLVVGTGNKTEILLGYSTLHGDAACGLNPLGNLYKTQVWDLAAHLGVPKEVIEKAPSADLWEGQTDEGELGFEYRRVDELLFFLYDREETDAQLIARDFEPEFIGRVRERIARYAFKRRAPRIGEISR